LDIQKLFCDMQNSLLDIPKAICHSYNSIL
jgi:hypothetical protein